MWYEWAFDGIGSQISGIIIGLIFGGGIGGFVGYRIGVKNRAKQKQKAGKGSTQTQIGNVTIISDKEDRNG